MKQRDATQMTLWDLVRVFGQRRVRIIIHMDGLAPIEVPTRDICTESGRPFGALGIWDAIGEWESDRAQGADKPDLTFTPVGEDSWYAMIVPTEEWDRDARSGTYQLTRGGARGGAE